MQKIVSFEHLQKRTENPSAVFVPSLSIQKQGSREQQLQNLTNEQKLKHLIMKEFFIINKKPTFSGSMLNFFFPVDNCLALGSSLELFKTEIMSRRKYLLIK